MPFRLHSNIFIENVPELEEIDELLLLLNNTLHRKETLKIFNEDENFYSILADFFYFQFYYFNSKF